MASSNPGKASHSTKAANGVLPFRIGAILLLGCSALFLSGCGSEESSDGTPPDTIINVEKSQGKYRFGVTDTLSIEFDEKIDTAALAVAISPAQGTDFRFKDARNLQVFGTLKTSGATHFTVKAPFSVTLAGLKDLSGNSRTSISESFEPYAWVDRDFQDSTFGGYDSLFATDSTWMDGSLLSTDSLVTEGIMDFKNNNSKDDDRQDFKIIRMLPPDTLKLSLTTSKGLNVKMQIAGPFPEKNVEDTLDKYDPVTASFFSDSTRSRGSLTAKFNASYSDHDVKLGSPSAPGIYVIRLSIPVDTEGFYRLGLRLRKLKK